MKKAQMLSEVFRGAKAYQKYVLDQQFLFIYKTSPNTYQYAEVMFKKENYQHLTGTKIRDVGSKDFFDRCIDKRIGEEQLEIATDGTAKLKLEVLTSAITGIGKASMFGIYDKSRIYLKTEKLIGKESWCIGFTGKNKNKNPSPLIANTLLKEDIRKISQKPFFTIVFSMIKHRHDAKYAQILRAVDHLDFKKIIRELGLDDIVDTDKLWEKGANEQ